MSDAYLETLDRVETGIAMLDRDTSLTSIAISLRRIADALEAQSAEKIAAIKLECLKQKLEAVAQ